MYRALANMLPGSSERQVKKVIKKEGPLDFQVESEVEKWAVVRWWETGECSDR